MLKMKKIWFFSIGIIFISILGCGTNNVSSSNVNLKQNETSIEFLNYSEEVTEKQIATSDFCIVGKAHIKGQKVLDEINWKDENGNVTKKPFKWNIEGEIKIDSVIYGKPNVKTIDFTMVTSLFVLSSEAGGQMGEFDAVWKGLQPKEDDTLIIFGKVEAGNIKIIKPIKRENISVFTESCKAIKSLLSLDKNESQKQREKLLVESNNQDLLLYLIRKIAQEEGLSKTISSIETLFTKGMITPEREFISYRLAMELVATHHNDIKQNKLTILNNIITKNLSTIATVIDGVAHLRIFDTKAFEQNYELKEGVKTILNNLSQKFKNDKDYSEWEKRVNKIFPPEEKTEK
ncbi:MAG: hypothetical protein HY811_09715 [Planctomycetes bacterium]|nr:hypothetical protein [Planctomycetota bacterium]